MKISEKQKREIRKRIIRTAVDAITEKGLKGATMRMIARSAGIGDATVYNYFSTKEAFVYAYYEEQLDESVERLESIADFSEYSLQEQLQAFFETQPDLFLPDREFVDISFRGITFSLTHDYKHLKAIGSRFFRIIAEMNWGNRRNNCSKPLNPAPLPRPVWDRFTGQHYRTERHWT